MALVLAHEVEVLLGAVVLKLTMLWFTGLFGILELVLEHVDHFLQFLLPERTAAGRSLWAHRDVASVLELVAGRTELVNEAREVVLAVLLVRRRVRARGGSLVERAAEVRWHAARIDPVVEILHNLHEILGLARVYVTADVAEVLLDEVDELVRVSALGWLAHGVQDRDFALLGLPVSLFEGFDRFLFSTFNFILFIRVRFF